MGIILYIGNNREIAENVDNIQSGSHRLTVLNPQYNYKHYIEEYMPDYILLSDNTDGFEEITDFVSRESGSQLIITGNKRSREDIMPGTTRVEQPETWERFRKIIQTIDVVDTGEKQDKGQYRFLKQEVVSFYSIQGGTGRTSIAFNTARKFKERDAGKVLIIDLNLCEGPSDLRLNLEIGAGRNLGDFIDDILCGEEDIWKNILSMEGIDILCPPMSLYQSDRLNIDILGSLIYSARNEYDLIITDLPFSYDNISLEMLNMSTSSVLVMLPDMRLAPRIKAFNKFIPASQKKLAVLNKVVSNCAVQADELEDMTGLTLCASIPFIEEKDRGYLIRNGRPTGIIDLQAEIDILINNIF